MRAQRRASLLVVVAMGFAMGCVLGGGHALAQASALPSAQVGTDADGAQRGRTLLDAMVKALGGEAWLNRQTWIFRGRTTTFYKGQPDGGALQFEEYGRMRPFTERVVMVSHYGALIAKDHADVADVWTGDRGFEITYKGTSPLPANKVEDFVRWRRHSLDTVVKDWLPQPGVLVSYAGTKMVERQLADEVSVVSASDDGVTLELDQSTHLPLSISFQWRDPVYKDWNTDVEEFANFNEVQGVMTPYAVTKMHNGDVVSERFLTTAVYNAPVAAEMFDPNQPLRKGK
ncbi:MAG: hypothetical protein WB439_12135 [Acidobacteriaceae bacterium]